MKKKKRGAGKPQGMTYMDMLHLKSEVKKQCEKASADAAVQAKSDIQTNRALWLMCVTMNDAFGIGPDRFERFAKCLIERSKWFNELVESADEVYAVEKLRQEAKRCSGIDIEYLYENGVLEVDDGN